MSTSIIVSLAFLVGFILLYRLLKKLIKGVLNKKRNKSRLTNEEIEKFRRDMLEYYKESSEKYKKLDIEVNKIMNEALDKANSIIKHNRQLLDQTLDDNTRSRLKKVTDQAEKAIGDLQANTANIAADAVKKIMREHKDDKRSSEIISSLSRDLNKKLH
ncbi:ATP synthase F0 subunit B [Wolbachia endosymbiont of Ctenocephalides felis wCfeJ]|uniref:ATP synthase F0 subunit B n=1 Tax=Wolbachia endosymbiont of Ctenocephalides felis wCfeJ TaxID=2732594 RepID=UPI00144841A2|nr:ATP synthase F0 subunit B [Wolbachia endosymbiont of Ctenocephalides felis wCfeJ]WCR57857.1 MAG: ATP synthase subunit b [Wolbachia endosymbiont of Ctenocephalides felis wCfeJ]